MKINRTTCVLLLVGVFFLSSLLAQGLEETVSMESLASHVLSGNPDLQAARLRIEEARGRLQQAGRLSPPQLEIEWSRHTEGSEGSFALGLAQQFPLTARLRLEKEVSAEKLLAAEAEVLWMQSTLIAQAQTVLVDLLAQKRKKVLLEKQYSLIDSLASFVEEASQRGEGSPIDAGQARLEALRLKTDMQRLDITQTSLTDELRFLLGRKATDQLKISGDLSELPLPSSAANPTRRFDYRALQAEIQATQKAVNLERARRFEDIKIGLFGEVGRTEDAPERLEEEKSVGIRIEIPLPFWSQNQGSIQEAEARLRRQQLEAQALVHKIEQETAKARKEMEKWSQFTKEISQKLLPAAEEQSALAEKAYREGQGDFQAVLRAQEQQLNLQASQLEALRAFHLAWIRYALAAGDQSTQ